MINIINKIFEEKNHSLIEIEGFKIFSLKEKYNYWVILEENNLSTILERQIEIFNLVKKKVNQPQFDKNVNLLLLFKIDNLQTIDRGLLLQIEEDAFHFKKGVIYYTEEELSRLSKIIGSTNPLDSIESLLLKEDVFEQHKVNFDNNEYQSLLYRIAHKIPFIKINVAIVNNLQSLEESNKKNLHQNNLNNLLEKDFFSLSVDEFTSLSDVDIFDKLKTILPNENQ